MSIRRNQTLTSVELQFYAKALKALVQSKIPFLVGGAYALNKYTSISRHTHDLDVFIRPDDWRRTQEFLEGLGYSTELTFPHWLGKAFFGDNFIDVIYSSGNAVATVDDAWFERSTQAVVLGVKVGIVPPEEIIWQKSFIMERERFDGADIAHLIRSCGDTIDWDHLTQRFADDWRVLLSHLVLFGYIYPAEKSKIPARIMDQLLTRLSTDTAENTKTVQTPSTNKITSEKDRSENNLCFGTILSREQYLIDIQDWGYKDARLEPTGPMSREEIKHWTAAIDR